MVDDAMSLTYIRLQAIDSTKQGNIRIQYSLDSCAFFVENSIRRSDSKEDIKGAQILITYTKYGKELYKEFQDNSEKLYSLKSDCSDDEKLFEFPESKVKFGQTWKTTKCDDNGFQRLKNKNILNKLIGIESKNGHNCYRIDFSGKVEEVTKQGDYIQTDKGKIIGSYWIEIRDKVLIAVESETSIRSSYSAHPGFNGPSFITAPSYRTKLKIVE